MGLSTYALVTLPELSGRLGAQGSADDPALEDSINRATAWIETKTERKFVTRGDVGELHTVAWGDHTIRLGERPIISVTSVHESTASPRVYDADSLLTADTEYQVVKELGRIRRLSSSELTYWARGYRAIKVLYDYGYANEAAVPDDLKQLCLFVADAMHKEADRGLGNVSSVTDAQGSITRFMGYLPPSMQEHLDRYSRGAEFEHTWEAA